VAAFIRVSAEIRVTWPSMVGTSRPWNAGKRSSARWPSSTWLIEAGATWASIRSGSCAGTTSMSGSAGATTPPTACTLRPTTPARDRRSDDGALQLILDRGELLAQVSCFQAPVICSIGASPRAAMIERSRMWA
jgi:hypothetical protein